MRILQGHSLKCSFSKLCIFVLDIRPCTENLGARYSLKTCLCLTHFFHWLRYSASSMASGVLSPSETNLNRTVQGRPKDNLEAITKIKANHQFNFINLAMTCPHNKSVGTSVFFIGKFSNLTSSRELYQISSNTISI